MQHGFHLYHFQVCYMVCLQNSMKNCKTNFERNNNFHFVPNIAVTICNMNQAKKSVVEQMASDSVEYNIVQRLCSRRIRIDDQLYTLGQYKGVMKNVSNQLSNVNILSTNLLFVISINQISQPCDEMIVKCQHAGLDCSSMFRALLTEHGYCCTFNMLPSAIESDERYIIG